MIADKTSYACEIETTSTAHGIVLSWAKKFVVCVLKVCYCLSYFEFIDGKIDCSLIKVHT